MKKRIKNNLKAHEQQKLDFSSNLKSKLRSI